MSESRAVPEAEANELLEALACDERGLVPVVAQDSTSGEVLMLAYANRDAIALTLQTGRAHYYSRSRSALWRKGDSSGNVQLVESVAIDCDGDSLLYRVRQSGPACHTGARSCFFRSAAVSDEGSGHSASGRADVGQPENEVGKSEASESKDEVGRGLDGAQGTNVDGDDGERQIAYEGELGRAFALLERVISQRLRDATEGSYVARLQQRGTGYMAQKVVEEAGETIVAALERHDDELIAEAADLLFHLSVLLAHRGQRLGAVAGLLEERHRKMSEE